MTSKLQAKTDPDIMCNGRLFLIILVVIQATSEHFTCMCQFLDLPMFVISSSLSAFTLVFNLVARK